MSRSFRIASQSTQVIKRGFDDTEPARQRYECTACHTRFDDLTDTIVAGHHQPLKVWVLCLYFMGLNVQTSPTFPLHQCGMKPTVPRTPPEVSSLRTF